MHYRKYNYNEFIGKRIGKFLIIDIIRKHDHEHFVIKCDCGNQFSACAHSVLTGILKECKDCIRVKRIGKVFGQLTIKSFYHTSKGGTRLKCLCSCGNEVDCTYSDISRSTKSLKSCGCYKEKYMKISKTKHNMSKTKVYNTFKKIQERCYNKSCNGYKNYGGRGIKCIRSSFDEFVDDMYQSYLDHISEFGSKQTTIERINVNGNYCKENCRRATREEQGWNKRNTIKILYNGSYMTLNELSKHTGMAIPTIRYRIKSGLPIVGVLSSNEKKGNSILSCLN